MDTILNSTTVSTQVLLTASASGSASAVVDMSKYANAKATLHIGKMVDNKGALSVTTLSLYECLSTGLTGSIVTASTVTNGLISNSAEVLLETEIKAIEMSNDFRYLYAHVTLPTVCDASCTITRGRPRFEPQD
jgi:hypothetical protein